MVENNQEYTEANNAWEELKDFRSKLEKVGFPSEGIGDLNNILSKPVDINISSEEARETQEICGKYSQRMNNFLKSIGAYEAETN